MAAYSTVLSKHDLARLQQIAAGLTQAGTQLAATERQDERWAGELAARKAEKLAWLHARMQQIEQWRKQKVDDYDGAIAEDYAATRMIGSFEEILRLRMKAVRNRARLDPMLEALGGVAVAGLEQQARLRVVQKVAA